MEGATNRDRVEAAIGRAKFAPACGAADEVAADGHFPKGCGGDLRDGKAAGVALDAAPDGEDADAAGNGERAGIDAETGAEGTADFYESGAADDAHAAAKAAHAAVERTEDFEPLDIAPEGDGELRADGDGGADDTAFDAAGGEAVDRQRTARGLKGCAGGVLDDRAADE